MSKFNTIFLTMLIIWISKSFSYAQNDTIMVDLGSVVSTGTWNNLTDVNGAGEITMLKNSRNLYTGMGIYIYDRFNGINTAGTTAPDGNLGFPSTATQDSYFGNTALFGGLIEPTGGILFTGLNPLKQYTFEIFASRTGVADNRETKYKFDGLTMDSVLLNPSNNTSSAVSITMQPKADGTINLIVSPGPNNNNSSGFFYLGAIKMIFEQEEILPFVKINSPNGGETWDVYTTQKIRWISTGIDKISIEYSVDNGIKWEKIADSLSAVTGSYNWLVPNTPTTEAKVRIYNVDDINIADTSESVFTIFAISSTVTLNSPNGYQQWEVGKVKKILFSSSGVANVRLEYSTDNGSQWQVIESSVSASTGEYNWTIPSTLSNEYLVKVSDANTPSVQDSSKYTFAVIPAKSDSTDFVIFTDSPSAENYDASYATSTLPSTLENYSTKLPVSSDFALSGNYSIKLNWLSATGGSWSAAIANPGWGGQDVTQRDSMILTVFTELETQSNDLPYIFIEDLSNQKTTKLPLSDFISNVPSYTWTRISIPMKSFIDNPIPADLTRIKTFFFSQNNPDTLHRVWYIGDLRSTGGKFITGDSTNLIVVLGSSTAAGTGASTTDSSWVGRFKNYVKSQDSTAVVVNLAIGGYTTYDIMPSGFVPPVGRPMPKINNNVTKALTYKPDAIIINLPSNDVTNGYSIEEQISNYEIIASTIGDSIPLWVSTTQPRNLDATGRANLMAMRDSTYILFKDKTIDFWTTVANVDGTINPLYNSGDGIHLNDSGHRILFDRVVGARVWSIVVAIEKDNDVIPTNFSLEQNYPNPFNPITTIRYSIPELSMVTLKVYDLLGREVTTLVNEENPTGYYKVTFNASSLASGVYFYRIVVGNYNETKKLNLIK